MKVDLVGFTHVSDELLGEATGDRWLPHVGDTAPDVLAEFAGRACYQSWDRPNPATAENKDYLANVIGQGHESVLAHASATFYVQGVSRSLTHELIRHRWLAFSELSQRYVNMDDAEMVIPPAMRDNPNAISELEAIFGDTVTSYGYLVDDLINKGLSRKEARQAARAVLPSMTETKIVVSGNLRAWRDFLKQRLSPHADAEIREFAEEIYRQLKEIAPHSMQGIE